MRHRSNSLKRHFNSALEKTKPNAEILLPNLLEDVISSSTLEDLYLNKLIQEGKGEEPLPTGRL